MKRFIALAACLSILGGCENMTGQQKAAGVGTLGGAAGGAVIGALAGNAALGTAIGAGAGLIGGLVYTTSRKIRRLTSKAPISRAMLPASTVMQERRRQPTSRRSSLGPRSLAGAVLQTALARSRRRLGRSQAVGASGTSYAGTYLTFSNVRSAPISTALRRILLLLSKNWTS